MKIVWSPEAIQDLILLRAYIAEESPAGAQRIVLRIPHDVEHLLPDNTQMGRPGRVPGTRELVVHGLPISYRTVSKSHELPEKPTPTTCAAG